ncbi:putative nonsense-mediated mrna decay protein [Phaeomoniella chlamydospora]|uniref:Putative nonsense-mediated mrna decay protein n=1 Tax=Phaeomoniella chlamydospora TaxID=158046 RepID=A0A0G2H1N5_PHACM|nr:putative nonsense-mediated mrna decay protein [Phaeomoniella chlamydospora]
MDVTALRGRIQATLDANADVRRQAELDLKYAEEQPGFPNALVDIIQAEQDNGVRLSTVVYLKNRITRGWAPIEEGVHKPIPDNERGPFKDRLLPMLASSPPQIRSQLVPILQTILGNDFPEKWPNFMDITLQLLNTHDANSVFAGLQCLLAICRTYRFKSGESRADLDKIVQAAFPPLLALANRLLEEDSNDAGEMMRIAVKCYKHAIYFELPAPLRAQQATVDWCTLFLRLIGKAPPPCSMMEDVDEREQNFWWKSKKWAYANLNRLYVRYGNPGTSSKDNDKEYGEYSKMFISTFAPEILKGYLLEIEKWVGGNHWLSKPSLSYTMIYLEECVKPKTMWDHLKPHMDTLVQHLVFPILCQSDEDLELFETDPSEYLHKKLNFYEEVSAPDMAATNFLIALTKSRKKQVFALLQFVNTVVNKYESSPDDQKLPREKEGALRMIGSLASVILGKKSPIADQVEYFFVRHVFPEFRSPHGYLRARACDTLEKFQQLDFKDPNNLMIIYRNILESMADPDLPVRVMAALALQPLIRHDVIRMAMQQNIPQIMQQLLKLANEVDVDALANVMEDFVEVFSEQLTPFAVALSEQLRDTYLRIVRELLERNETKGDEYADYLDDKSIAALGVLQTIGTLILTLEASPDVLLHLETILMPVITITLENKLYDLYNEVFEIVDSCTFASKAISDTMWQAFELIHKTFKEGAELYLEDMLPALDNFVTYGHQGLIAKPQYLAAMVGMVRDIFTDPKVGGVDRICGCKLAEAIMLNLRGHVDNYVPIFIELAMNVLAGSSQKTLVKSYKIHLMEMVVNGIYYNPLLAMRVLESKGWTNRFFSLWFSNIDSFRRVHDKKLCICAISGLLTLRADQVPHSVQTGWPRLLAGVTAMFRTLPAAVKVREEAARANDLGDVNDDYADGDDSEDDWTGADVEWTGEEETAEEGDVKDESAAYLEFLNKEAQKFGQLADDDDDDDLDEDSLLESPLDKIEPYLLFRDSLLRLQQEQPPLYNDLTKVLTPDDQQILQGVIVEAENRAVQAQQAQAQMAQAAMAAGAPPPSA